MGRIIPNENTWVGFIPEADAPDDYKAPKLADIAAAVELTEYLVSINASSRGNAVPTPNFKTLFETSITGTSQATFDADFYRDDEEDDAWDLLPRGTKGYFIVSRFGTDGERPAATDKVEVWPVEVTSRTAANLGNNTVQTFTVSCAVNLEPAENAVVGA